MGQTVYNWPNSVKLCYGVLCCVMLRQVSLCGSMRFCFALRYANVLFCLVLGSLLRNLSQLLQDGFYLTYGNFTMTYKRQVLLDKANIMSNSFPGSLIVEELTT